MSAAEWSEEEWLMMFEARAVEHSGHLSPQSFGRYTRILSVVGFTRTRYRQWITDCAGLPLVSTALMKRAEEIKNHAGEEELWA